MLDLSAIHGTCTIVRRSAHLKRVILQPHGVLDAWVVAVCEQILRILHGWEPVALRRQPGFLRHPEIELPA